MKKKYLLLIITIIVCRWEVVFGAEKYQTISAVANSPENRKSPELIDKTIANHLVTVTNSKNRVLVPEKKDGKYTEKDIIAVSKKFGSQGGVVDLGTNRTYTISKKFNFKTKVSYIAGENVIWDATAKKNGILLFTYSGWDKNDKRKPRPENITFYNINFKNIGISFYGAGKHVLFLYCLFDDHKSPDIAKNGVPTNSGLESGGISIRLGHSKHITIYRCAFFYDLRTKDGHPHVAGAAVKQYKTYDVVIEQCYFEGFVVKATDYTGVTRAVLSRTTAKRTILDDLPESYKADYPVTGRTYAVDHGHYFHGFTGILIQYNFMTGWPHAASGGLKVRNGKKAMIYRNIVYNMAGIITYNYNKGEPNSLFANITVEENLMVNKDLNGYDGYFYWNNGRNGGEYSNVIINNIIYNGTITLSGVEDSSFTIISNTYTHDDKNRITKKYVESKLMEVKGNKRIDVWTTTPRKLMSAFLKKHKTNKPFVYKRKK